MRKRILSFCTFLLLIISLIFPSAEVKADNISNNESNSITKDE